MSYGLGTEGHLLSRLYCIRHFLISGLIPVIRAFISLISGLGLIVKIAIRLYATNKGIKKKSGHVKRQKLRRQHVVE